MTDSPDSTGQKDKDELSFFKINRQTVNNQPYKVSEYANELAKSLSINTQLLFAVTVRNVNQVILYSDIRKCVGWLYFYRQTLIENCITPEEINQRCNINKLIDQRSSLISVFDLTCKHSQYAIRSYEIVLIGRNFDDIYIGGSYCPKEIMNRADIEKYVPVSDAEQKIATDEYEQAKSHILSEFYKIRENIIKVKN